LCDPCAVAQSRGSSGRSRWCRSHARTQVRCCCNSWRPVSKYQLRRGRVHTNTQTAAEHQAASQALRAPRIFGRCEILILMCPLFAAFVMVAPKFFELCRCHPQPFQGERTPSHHGRWRAARDCEGCHACVQRRGRYRAEEMRAGLLTCTAISPTHIHAFSLSVDFPFLSVEVLEEELAPSTVSPRALCGWTWPQCTSSASRVVCA
jgi:hypothetical protein